MTKLSLTLIPAALKGVSFRMISVTGEIFPNQQWLKLLGQCYLNNNISQAELLSEWLHDNGAVGLFLCDFLHFPSWSQNGC